MAAIMVAAVFAGVVLIDDEADAVEVGDIVAVSYTDGKFTSSEVLGEDAQSITIDAITDYDSMESENFECWTSASGTPYYAGAKIAIATISADDLVNGVFVLTAHYKVTTVNFIGADGEIIGAGQTPGSVTVPEAPAVEGKVFVGWLYSIDNKVYKVYDEGEGADADDNITKVIGSAKAGETFTAQYSGVYTVTWVVDGVTIATQKSNELTQPSDPVKANYNFVGWAVDGKVVSVMDQGKIVIPADYAFTDDTKFVAEFKPIQLTVTLMVDGKEYGTQTVLYNDRMVAPALPADCAYWATMTKEAVLDENGNIVEPAEYTQFNFPAVITSNMTLYAIAGDKPVPDESIYATFNIEGTIYGPYKVTDRFSIPQTDREGYNFLGWTVQGGDGTRLTSEQVQNYQYTKDVTFVAIYEVAEPPAPEEPAFYETTTGQVAIIIVVFALLFFGYAVYSNMGGLKDKLFGYTISKKEKKE